MATNESVQETLGPTTRMICFYPVQADGTGPAHEVPLGPDGARPDIVPFPAQLGTLTTGPTEENANHEYWQSASNRLSRLTVQQLMTYITALEGTIMARNADIVDLTIMIHLLRTRVLDDVDRPEQLLNFINDISALQAQAGGGAAADTVLRTVTQWIDDAFPPGIQQVPQTCPARHPRSAFRVRDAYRYVCLECQRRT